MKNNFEKSSGPVAGRIVGSNGENLGDAKFFERDMDFTAQEEKRALMELASQDVDLAVQQVKTLVAQNQNLEAKAYRHLLELYPDDSRAQEWVLKT